MQETKDSQSTNEPKPSKEAADDFRKQAGIQRRRSRSLCDDLTEKGELGSLSDGKTGSPRQTIKTNQSHWVTAIAIVKFDIDRGQVMEGICPPEEFTKTQQKTVCLLSFPDSNSFAAEGNLQYVFRMKNEIKRENSGFDSLYGYVYFKQRKDETNARGYSQKSIVILSPFPFIDFFKNVLETLAGEYFKQEDEISPDQFLSRTYEVIAFQWERIKPGFFNQVELYGNTFAINIPKNALDSKHVDLLQNKKLQLINIEEQKDPNNDSGNLKSNTAHNNSGFLNEESTKQNKVETDTSIQTNSNDQINNEATNGSNQANSTSDNKPPSIQKNLSVDQVNGTNHQGSRSSNLSTMLNDVSLQEVGLFQDINLYRLFKGEKLPLVWKLWELVLTNQPVMIISDLPDMCSDIILGMVSLIHPLEFQSEFKPYFTIYDPEYKSFQDMYTKKMVPCSLIGVTNPLFLKVMKSFPNILHLEKDYLVLAMKDNKNKKPPELLITQDKLVTQPDPSLKTMLMKLDTPEVDAINNTLLRKSIRQLTSQFLKTFSDYFKLQVNDIKKFEERDFLKFVELQKFPFKSQFFSQDKIIALYKKFLKSSNFMHYIKKFPNVYFVKNIKS